MGRATTLAAWEPRRATTLVACGGPGRCGPRVPPSAGCWTEGCFFDFLLAAGKRLWRRRAYDTRSYQLNNCANKKFRRINQFAVKVHEQIRVHSRVHSAEEGKEKAVANSNSATAEATAPAPAPAAAAAAASEHKRDFAEV